MRVAILSGNLGSYDEPHPWVEQNFLMEGAALDIFRFDDESFPPRPKAMTSRLMAGMPKMFGWQIRPGYDVYIWIDASCVVSHQNTVQWFLDHLHGAMSPSVFDMQVGLPQHYPADFALFRHPDRKTVREEWEFMRRKLAEGNGYLMWRYGGEYLDQQADEIFQDPNFKDDALYASTAFAYRNTERVRSALKEWWYHKSRYLLHDQLALPYVIQKFGCKVNVINEHYMKTPYLTFVRRSKRYK
jgi:hypothetical protein